LQDAWAPRPRGAEPTPLGGASQQKETIFLHLDP
jgi:hypothetical protein